MFGKDTYVERRQLLRRKVGNGLIIILGNTGAPMNYPANTYKFHQDSSFRYFFAQTRDGLAGAIDADSGEEWFLGDDVDIEDIVWYGTVHSVAAMAEEIGVAHHAPFAHLGELVKDALEKKRKVHFLPPYRHDAMILLHDLLGIHPKNQRATASVSLIKAVVDLRTVKSPEEIEELEKAAEIGYQMHTTAMRLCRPGVTEQFIAGTIDGIASAYGNLISFPSIVTMHGEILHGYPSPAPLEAGKLFLCDAGAVSNTGYCSDNTRTTPISGHFTTRQREIYDIVVDCHDFALKAARPGARWKDVHLDICRLMTSRLKDLGLMKGNVEDAVQAGAHALFMPHGLGHMMGMDVHDMEALGQNYVGYDEETRPCEQFGLASLRFARRLDVGHVMTDEPGIYFIPNLIDFWREEEINADFLCFDKIEEYKNFGGIRIEDDIVITPDGCRFLGAQRIPYKADEVESFINK